MPNSLSRFLAVALAVAVVAVVPRVRAEAAGEYYYNAGRRVPIVRSETRVAVHLGDAASKIAAVDRLAATEGVRAVRDVKAGGIVEVTLASGAAKAPSSGLRDVALALGGELVPVFHEGAVESDASTLFVADDLLARFKPGVTRSEIDALAARLGLEVLEPLSYAPNGFRLRVASNDLDHGALEAANACFESGLCEWAHPNFLAHRTLRFTPNDPAYSSQWHLKNTGQGSGTVGADVDAEDAWEITKGSAEISIAVADTGIDYHHEDFNVATDEGPPKVHDPRDVVHGDDDPSPQPGDENVSHGTSAAGVAVAAFNNNLDTAGIAPDCRLVPIQLYAESTFTPNATEADAFTWAADHADIMSNSWGPDLDDTPLPDATRAAMDYAVTTGRGGKGTVIFFAAGNSADDTIHDNYVSNPDVVAVAASTNFDMRAGYSRFGAAVSVCAPSSGGSLGIATTDVTGATGYSSGNFTTAFGGTSSACPLAAGTAALVLSVNPDLTWQEVKGVLEQTADKIDTADGAYDASGRSIYYGYGRVNARAAVELAQQLANSGAPRATLAQTSAPVGAGGVFAVSWSVTGENPIASQKLEYSIGDGTFLPIADVAPGTTSFSWDVPDNLLGSVTLRLTVEDTQGQRATSAIVKQVWQRPTVSSVKLKKSASGKRILVVDGAYFRADEATVFVGDTELGSLKFPKGRLVGDGTATRIVSKDSRLDALVPAGTTVEITVRHPSTRQVSAVFSYTR